MPNLDAAKAHINQVLITGGTGSFGKAMVKRLINTGELTPKMITVFSRDEDKQELMRREYENEAVSFMVGDVRDYNAVSRAMYGIDYVFHAAALKQVPSCEYNPMEAIHTNLVGSNNVFKAALENGVKSVVGLSTDKACYPINTMGMTKALMEKLAVDYARFAHRQQFPTRFNLTRYGNVAGSRGSAIPLFMSRLKQGLPLELTDPKMTRFLLTMDDAIDLVLYAMQQEDVAYGNTFVLNAPATTVQDLAEALCMVFDKDFDIDIVGTRPGEKKHETLITQEEMTRATLSEDGRFFKVRREFGTGYTVWNMDRPAFTSEHAQRLTVPEITERLRAMDFVQKELYG